MDMESLNLILNCDPRFESTKFYIGTGDNPQGMGVIATMQNVIRSILQSVFSEDGRFSIREFVRNKQGRTLFIEYDLSKGSILTPIYKLLMDLALKESLGRSHSEGNVYFICDEFKLLPNLEYICDAVNFGRSMGVKVLIGIQSVDQLFDIYGEYRSRSLISGFSSVISFKSNDQHTREFSICLYGKNLIQCQVKRVNGTIDSEVREGNVVEDWDVSDLNVGEAIVGLGFNKPFKMKFDLYRRYHVR